MSVDDDTLQEALDDAISDGEGRISAYYIKHHFAKRGLAIAAAPLPPAETGDKQIWRHGKRGTTYTIEDRAVRVQCETPLQDDETVLLYRDTATGHYCIRREAEFMDGRFVADTPDVQSPAIAARRERQASEGEGMETSALIEALRSGPGASLDYGIHLRKYQNLCNRAADALARLSADNERLRADCEDVDARNTDLQDELRTVYRQRDDEAALASKWAERTTTAESALAALRENVEKVLEPLAQPVTYFEHDHEEVILAHPKEGRSPLWKHLRAARALLADIKKERGDG